MPFLDTLTVATSILLLLVTLAAESCLSPLRYSFPSFVLSYLPLSPNAC